MRLLVIIPTFNEIDTIANTIDQLFVSQPDVDVLVVDDNSPDGTADLVRSLMNSNPRVHLLSRARKAGLGTAYLAGFDYGIDRGYQYIVEMDADGSHRTQDLGKLLVAAAGADLVIGSRWIAGGAVENWPALRRLVSRLGNAYAKFMLGTSIADMTSGYRVFKAEFLKQIINPAVSSHGYSFQVELAYRASRSGKVVEVPITFVERIQGRSKMTLAIVLEALARVTFWGIKRIFS